MKYRITPPRKLPSGKRAPYYGVRLTLESAYEEQAFRQLYPNMGNAPKGEGTKGKTETRFEEVRRAVEHRAHLLSMDMPVQDTVRIEKRAEEYLEWGRVQGGKGGLPWAEGHDTHVSKYLRDWTVALNLSTMTDIRQGPFDQEVSRLRKRLTPNTVNRRAQTLTGFCTWAVRSGYLKTSPIRFRALDKTPVNQRGAFHLDELRTLFQGVPWLRGVLYRTAYYLRFRRNEVWSLKPSSFLWAEGLVRLDYRSAKNRKTAFLPVPGALLADLWQACQGLPEDAKIFPLSKKNAARNLHRDMDRLGIPVMLNGRRRDFHSLGASTATSMSRQKVAPALMTRTMRHASWKQTEEYIKLESEELRVVTQGLEDEIVHTHDTQDGDMATTPANIGVGGVGRESLTLRPHLLPFPDHAKKPVKFRKSAHSHRPDTGVTWPHAQKILTQIRHTLQSAAEAADLEAFLALPAEERAKLVAAKRESGAA